MRCPGETTLALLHDGELSPADRARVERHLEGCPACARRRREMEALDGLIGAADDEPRVAGFLARARTIPDRAAVRPAPPRAAVRAAAAVLLAATLAAAGWLLGFGDDSGDPPAAPPVADAEPPGLRERVARALSGPEPAPAVVRLGPGAILVLSRLATEEDPETARAALRCLADLARPRSLPAVLRAVRMEDRQREAIKALGAVGDERALRELEPLLAAGRHEPAVLRALESIGGLEAAELIFARIEDETSLSEAIRLVETLSRVGGEQATRRLLELTEHRHWDDLAREAVAARGPALLPDLAALAAGRSGTDARRAIVALGILGLPEAVPALAPLLERRERRADVARALARIDSVSAAEALEPWLRFPDVREAFALAGPRIEGWLTRRLDSGSRRTRGEAAGLLARCGTARAVPALFRAAGDRAIAPAVLRALGGIGGEWGVTAIESLAERPALLRDAVEALGETEADDAVPVLAALADRHRSLESEVVRALERIGSTAAREAAAGLEARGGPPARPPVATDTPERDGNWSTIY